MPQLLALALVGAGVWAGLSWLRREGDRVAREIETADSALRARDATLRNRDGKDPKLVRDPETGVYRPGDDAR